MDWRGRKYYCVSFDWRSSDMRLNILKSIGNIKIHTYKDIPKQPDESEERGYYQFMLGIPTEYSDAVEYELRIAEQRDNYCKWKEIKRNRV